MVCICFCMGYFLIMSFFSEINCVNYFAIVWYSGNMGRLSLLQRYYLELIQRRRKRQLQMIEQRLYGYVPRLWTLNLILLICGVGLVLKLGLSWIWWSWSLACFIICYDMNMVYLCTEPVWLIWVQFGDLCGNFLVGLCWIWWLRIWWVQFVSNMVTVPSRHANCTQLLALLERTSAVKLRMY